MAQVDLTTSQQVNDEKAKVDAVQSGSDVKVVISGGSTTYSTASASQANLGKDKRADYKTHLDNEFAEHGSVTIEVKADGTLEANSVNSWWPVEAN